MTLRDQTTESIKQSREERESSDSGERETVDNIEINMSEIAFTHFHPTSILTGKFPEDEGNPVIRFPDQQHNDGRRDQGYLGLVLDDMGVLADEDEGTDGTVILDVHESNEVRVFNEDDDQTTVGEGNGMEAEDLVKYGDRTYEGTLTDEFPVDRSIAVVGGAASKSVAKALDVNGAQNADMDADTGDVNGGLIEYAPDDVDADVRSRYARNPELREDLYGTDVAILVGRREEIDDDVTGYLGRDGEAQDGDPVLGEGPDGQTHTDPFQASYAELVEAGERRSMKWFSVFADFGDGLEKVEPVEGEPTGYTYLEWRFDPQVGRLPDEDYEFVETYVEEGAPTDEDVIRQNIEDNAENLSDDPNKERIVELIQNMAE